MLNDRKKKILKAIVEDYIDSSQPVGSKTLVENYDLNVSPATIRNEMAELEDMGYLDKPHTSAGRVPSTLGYRFYVDALMKENNLNTDEIVLIKEKVENEILQVNEIVKHIGKAVSDITQYTVVSTGPSVKNAVIDDIKLVLLSNNMLLIIVLTEDSSVKETILKLDREINEEIIKKINEVLRTKLKGVYIKNIDKILLRCVEEQISKYLDILLKILNEIINIVEENNIELDGANNIFKHPESKDSSLVKNFLDVIEGKELIKETLQLEDNDINIYIGDENSHSEFKDFSVITYKCPNNLGAIGIIGPTRMDYSKVIAVIKYINKIINSKYGNGGMLDEPKEKDS